MEKKEKLCDSGFIYGKPAIKHFIFPCFPLSTHTWENEMVDSGLIYVGYIYIYM